MVEPPPNANAKRDLEEKYLLARGRVLISGRQALVRLPLAQRRRDRHLGWSTAGFITGYRGSPLGGYDSELWRARSILESHDILFQPGLNEDLAATAVWGTQQVGFVPGRKVEGVFSIWYGKGPGVDRSGDPLKHANLAGTEPRGGVLLVCGDDHAGKSSSTAHQSDLALAANDIPVLYPSTVAEILEYGLAGIALSRFAGLLVGLKLVNETAEATAAIEVDDAAPVFIEPQMEAPPGGVHIRKEFLATQQQDARLLRHKLPRAQAFVRANRMDRITYGSTQPVFVIATAGKCHADVLGALELLGIDEGTAKRMHLAVYKVALIFPLEPQGLRELAATAAEIFFVEEKRSHIERQAANVLINLADSPLLSGKADPLGEPLLPADVPIEAATVALALERRLRAAFGNLDELAPAFAERARALHANTVRSQSIQAGVLMRLPAFCAGCPHNTSTNVPAGSVGMTGIGCHSMVILLPDRNPLPVTHMGGEGATWIGMAPFTSTSHVFQNLGDGTYNHSGSLAIRAATQTGTTLTYKILYNDAVAMTGGQPVEGHRSVAQIAAQVLAEGVAEVVVVSDHPERFQGGEQLPQGLKAHHRSELDGIQRRLRAQPGVTVLIYDQTCAAEKRRRGKRKPTADAQRRVFINERVCEGCGDCSTQSNCLAIQPLETDLGRKRAIDQSACNKDFSCTQGFCPSFVTVEGAVARRERLQLPEALFAGIHDPGVPALGDSFDMLVAGIGGTGVLTISAVIGMAAHLEGRGVSLYDMTGLSQKGGAVLSHIRLSADPHTTPPARIGLCEADLILACDVVAAVQKEAIETVDAQRTAIVVNRDLSATAAFQAKPQMALDVAPLLEALSVAAGKRAPLTVAASSLAERSLGDTIATNMLMLGFAWQSGHVPIARGAIERAIELNGVAVSFNKLAFRVGRAAAAAPQELQAALAPQQRLDAPTEDFDIFVARRIVDLTAYWNARYANTYAQLVRRARECEATQMPGTDTFAWAVARSAFKLMAYKDEYEVARLYCDGAFRARLDREMEPGYRIRYHLAPPLWSRPDARTGRPRKLAFGPWMSWTFRMLAKLKGVRETPFDLFGLTAERRLERRLRDDYLSLIDKSCLTLSRDNHERSVSLAAAPLLVRGFGPVRAKAAAELSKSMELARS